VADLAIAFRGQQVDVLHLMHQIAESPRSAEYSPWFFTYYRDLTGYDYMSRYLRFLRKLVSALPNGLDGQSVLDAGCGFGIMSTLLALLGAARVDGIDCHQGMIDTFAAYLPMLPYDLPVYPQTGNVEAMPYSDCHFDIVLSHEAVSHYQDVDGFLREAYRVLKPGGALLLSDSNNSLNSDVRRETQEIWTAFEQGPPTEEIHGHRVETPFVDQREEIIRAEFGLSAEEARMLAEHTSGLAGSELRDAVARYVSDGSVPDCVYRPGMCPIDPVQGYYIEYLFDPWDLARQMEELGFRVRLRAYLGGARGGVLSLANDLLTLPPFTRIVLPRARAFRMLAIKAVA